MKIMCEQLWFLACNELPNKDEVVLTYNGEEFEKYHFIDCFPPDIDMWCRFPDFWRLKMSNEKNRYEIALSSGKSFEFDSSVASLDEFMERLSEAIQFESIYIKLNDDVSIKIESIEMIRRVND